MEANCSLQSELGPVLEISSTLRIRFILYLGIVVRVQPWP